METQINTPTLETNYRVTAQNQNLFKIVGERNLDRKTVATHHIKKGEIIHHILPYSVTTYPDFLTVQVGTEKHIMDLLLEAMNHSCSPTTFVDVVKMQVIALKDISPEEELTFFYPSTEWEMDRPFQCNCQSSQCIGLVNGAKNLPISQRMNFRFNLHITKLINSSLNFDGNL